MLFSMVSKYFCYPLGLQELDQVQNNCGDIGESGLLSSLSILKGFSASFAGDELLSILQNL